MTVRQMRDAQHVLDAVVTWARTRPDVVAVGLAGSHARGTARPSSDVDLVVLVQDPAALLGDDAWLAEFGDVTNVADEDWGAVRSRRVHYRAGPEVEFGLTSPAWARLPLDAGTARVVRDGFRVLHDPDGLLAEALRAAAPSTDDLVVDEDDGAFFVELVESGDERAYAILSRDGTFHGICALNRVDPRNRTANLGYWLRASSTPVARRLHLHEEGVRTRAIRVGDDQHDTHVFAAFPSDLDRLVT